MPCWHHWNKNIWEFNPFSANNISPNWNSYSKFTSVGIETSYCVMYTLFSIRKFYKNKSLNFHGKLRTFKNTRILEIWRGRLLKLKYQCKSNKNYAFLVHFSLVVFHCSRSHYFGLLIVEYTGLQLIFTGLHFSRNCRQYLRTK